MLDNVMIVRNGSCYDSFITSSREVYDIVSRALQEGGELYSQGLRIVAERTDIEEKQRDAVLEKIGGLVVLMNSGEMSGPCVVQRSLSSI